MSAPTAFRARLEARGADLGRWPWPARLAARALLAVSPAARAALAEAARLDALLAETLAPEPVDPTFLATLQALAERTPQPAAAPAPARGRLPTFARLAELGAASALAVVLAGVLFGAAGPFAPEEEPRFDLAAVVYAEIPDNPMPFAPFGETTP